MDHSLINGAIMMGCWAIGQFFFQFWSKTRDRFFLSFCAAFWVLGVERIILQVLRQSGEFSPYVYTVRLIAFSLIIWAIIQKNRESKSP